MHGLEFEWDPKKAQSNLDKHGVSFDEAKTVFSDDYARLIPDPDHSVGEQRFILLGASIHSRLIVVCHVEIDVSLIRIISARRADKIERQIYQGFRDA